jgi:hypothetical protein
MDQMKRNTVIYFNEGDDYRGEMELSPAMRKDLNKLAYDSKQVGYLSGYRYFDGQSDGVIVYCSYKPSEDDIEKRRKNGFLAARWYWL